MKHVHNDNNWIIRLNKDERLMELLQKFVSEHNIHSAWISGIGGAQWVKLGFYDLKAKQYQWHEFSELLEIINLSGNIAWQNGKPVIHIHGTFSDRHMKAIGGHVKELVVGGTCEIFLSHWQGDQITRFTDNNTGLNLLGL